MNPLATFVPSYLASSVSPRSAAVALVVRTLEPLTTYVCECCARRGGTGYAWLSAEPDVVPVGPLLFYSQGLPRQKAHRSSWDAKWSFLAELLLRHEDPRQPGSS